MMEQATIDILELLQLWCLMEKFKGMSGMSYLYFRYKVCVIVHIVVAA